MKRVRRGIIPKLILTVFIIYTACNLISLQFDIHKKREEIKNLNIKIEEQQRLNKSLEENINSDLSEEEIKRIARDKLGLAEADEKVFYNITGE